MRDYYKESTEDFLEDLLICVIRNNIDKRVFKNGIYENKDIFEGYKRFKYLLEVSQKAALRTLIHDRVGKYYDLKNLSNFTETDEEIIKAKEFQEYFLKELRELDRI